MTAITCKRCGSAVNLDSPDKMTVWAPRGARLRCDGCGADLGLLQRVLEYLEQRSTVSA